MISEPRLKKPGMEGKGGKGHKEIAKIARIAKIAEIEKQKLTADLRG